MQPESDKSNPTESHLYAVPANSAFPEPWWRRIGYNPIPPVEQGKSDLQRSTFRCSNGGSDSNGGRSLAHDGESEEDDEESHGGSPNAASPRSGEAHGREMQNQLADPNVPTMHYDYVSRPPHLELAGIQLLVHLIHVEILTMLDDGSLWSSINGKIVHFEVLILVDSYFPPTCRHQHAMRRKRGSGGCFAKKSEMDASNAASEEKGKSSGPALSSQSASSSSSGPLATDSAKNWDSSGGHITGQQARATHHYTNGNENGKGGFKPSACNPHSGKGDGLGFRR